MAYFYYLKIMILEIFLMLMVYTWARIINSIFKRIKVNFFASELWAAQIKIKKWTGNMPSNIAHSYYYTP